MSVIFKLGDPASDDVSETASPTFFRRFAGSFAAATVGCALFCAAIGVLVWNEGREVEAQRGLSQAASHVTEVSSTDVDSAKDGKLVHLTGEVTTPAALSDPLTGVSKSGLIRLKRTVEMFQWKETRQPSSGNQIGGTERIRATYSYAKKWSEDPIDSSRFKALLHHENPAMPIRTEMFTARDTIIGARVLAPVLLERLGGFQPLVPPAQAPVSYVRTTDGLYRGRNSEAPEIGDIRVTFAGVPAQIVSVLAAQQGRALTSFPTKHGYEVGLLVTGDQSAAAMVAQQRANETVLTWVFRVVGFALFVLSLVLIASPLAALAGALPFVASIVGGSILVFALSVAVPLTLTTVGLAWLAFRPLLGVTLLVAAGLLVYGYRYVRHAKAPRRAASRVPNGSVPAA